MCLVKRREVKVISSLCLYNVLYFKFGKVLVVFRAVGTLDIPLSLPTPPLGNLTFPKAWVE